MSENKNTNPKGEPNNNPIQKNESTINKDSKNPNGNKDTVDEADDEDQIENPDKNREHDDTDHEHDYKTPADNSFNQTKRNGK